MPELSNCDGVAVVQHNLFDGLPEKRGEAARGRCVPSTPEGSRKETSDPTPEGFLEGFVFPKPELGTTWRHSELANPENNDRQDSNANEASHRIPTVRRGC